MSAKLGPWAHGVFRIAVGFLFMEHGLQKLFGLFGGVPPSGAAVPLISLFGLAGVMEFAGGALIVIGLLTIPTAAILFAEMVVAHLMVHAPQGRWPIQNQGELALLYAAAFLFMVGNGAGAFSVDASIPFHLHPERRHTLDRRMAA